MSRRRATGRRLVDGRPMGPPAWLAPYMAHAQAIDLEPSETPCHIEIRHDDDCAIWYAGEMACDCRPVVESGVRVDAAFATGQVATDGMTFYKDGRMLHLTRNALGELGQLPEDEQVAVVRRLLEALTGPPREDH
jgi:hypothetical protein